MPKNAPSFGRILAMSIFALSCVGLLLFLWLSFGGPTPLQPKKYEFKVHVPEAATLALESDVRMAGVNVGKVKEKELDKKAARTIVTIQIEEKFAPIKEDARVMLRQKTLLGETYVEIAPGPRDAKTLKDGDTLENAQVEETVELDEIFSAFDKPTREAWREWTAELAKAMKNNRGEDLSDAFGNLPLFLADGADVLEVLDQHNTALRLLVRNTGRVFGAINQREGALRELIRNSGNTFEATASRDEALAETFQIFPTFLDESRLTMTRLEAFARNTRPLVNDLKGPADDLGPTLRDLGDLAPDLEALFRDLPPLIRAGERGLPELDRILNNAEPLLEALHTFLTELNPVLAYLNFHQTTVAGFLATGGANINGQAGGERYQVNVGIIEDRSFQRYTRLQPWARGNAYLHPNALGRAPAFGAIESFTCDPRGGEFRDPLDFPPPGQPTQPPCFVAPPSLFNGKQFVKLTTDDARKVDPPRGLQGSGPADPNSTYDDPAR